MTIKYFDTSVIGAYLIDAWQNHLSTEQDPTGGKWFKNGPENSAGLFGGLTDTLASELHFDAQPAPATIHPELCFVKVLDNRNGLLPQGGKTTLQWEITNETSMTHSTSQSIKSGISEEIKVGVNLGVEVESTTTISFEYSYSWDSSKTETQTDRKTYTEEVDVAPPAGKAYRLIVMADRKVAKIPYSARVFLTGTSETNFAASFNGQTRYSADAGTVCQWIADFKSVANGDETVFLADPDDPTRGIAELRGVVTASQAVNFLVVAVDWTDVLNGTTTEAAVMSALSKGPIGSAPGVVSATPVAAQPV